jgi:hypothetical protein
MWDIIMGSAFIGVGAYLVASTKDDAPNRKTLKGFGIFFIIVGVFAFAYGVARMVLLGQGVPNSGYTPNPVYEMPQTESAVIEPNIGVQNATPPNNTVQNAAPNGTTVIVNQPNGTPNIGKRNNKIN